MSEKIVQLNEEAIKGEIKEPVPDSVEESLIQFPPNLQEPLTFQGYNITIIARFCRKRDVKVQSCILYACCFRPVQTKLLEVPLLKDVLVCKQGEIPQAPGGNPAKGGLPSKPPSACAVPRCGLLETRESSIGCPCWFFIFAPVPVERRPGHPHSAWPATAQAFPQQGGLRRDLIVKAAT